MNKKHRLSLLFIFSIYLLIAVGCDFSTIKKDNGNVVTTLEKAQKAGKIVVGFANENPYAYLTPDGKITGQGIEVARVILKELGINEMEGVLTDFSSLIPGLKSGSFDMVIAGMHITPERCKEIAFGEPEFSNGLGIAVKKGNPKNIQTYEDIIDKGISIAIISGTVENSYLTDMGLHPKKIVSLPDIPATLQALEAGHADAIAMTQMTLKNTLQHIGANKIEKVEVVNYPIINGEEVRGYGAAAFRQSDTDFIEAYNKELAKLKESNQLIKIIEKFGFTENELPGDKSTEQLCKKE